LPLVLFLYKSGGRGNWLDGGTGRFLANEWTGVTALFQAATCGSAGRCGDRAIRR
jgi:hypothetical protein